MGFNELPEQQQIFLVKNAVEAFAPGYCHGPSSGRTSPMPTRDVIV